MWDSENDYESLLEGWERSETTNGLPYYINHSRECTQWDHPLLVKTLEKLVEMDSIRYAAYRTSMKLRFIQKHLCFDLVTLNTIQAVFERQGLSADMDTVVDCGTLYNLLVDMYRLSHTEIMSSLNKDQLAELTLNWLLNLYDVNRTGCICVVSVKVGLGALCSAKLSEKYRYFFRHLADLTNHMTRKRVHGFLHDLIQIPEVLNESQPFGGLNVSPAVESCFSQAWGSPGVSEDVFLTWLLQEPQTLVWLPTLHRLAAAESVKHDSKCSVCKAYPIIGFRYKCLKCFNYDLCQQCFFTGRTTKKHKLTHPTQEYCVATTSKQDTKAFMKIVRNNLSKKHCNKQKLRYLPIYGTEQAHNKQEEFNLDEGPANGVQDLVTKTTRMKHELPADGITKVHVHDAMHEKLSQDVGEVGERVRQELDLHSVIRHLEDENRELMKEIERLHGRRGKKHFSKGGAVSDEDWSQEDDETSGCQQEVLEAHNQQLEVQLRRLRHVLRQSTENLREPLQLISTNTGSVNYPGLASNVAMTPPRLPQQPPSYGVSIGHSPLSAAMSVRRHRSPSAIALTKLRIQSDDDLPDEGVSELVIDTPDGSTMEGLSRTRFSLPSLGGSRYFPEEEAVLDGLIERLDEAYPADMSHSVLGNGENSTLDEMLRAANQIGDGLGGFTTHPYALELECSQTAVSPANTDGRPLGGSTSPVAPSLHG